MAKKFSERNEPDSIFFLKILLFFVLGNIWVIHNGTYLFPAGLVAGILFATHDHFRIDRKLEYVILILSCLFSLLVNGGLRISL